MIKKVATEIAKELLGKAVIVPMIIVSSIACAVGFLFGAMIF